MCAHACVCIHVCVCVYMCVLVPTKARIRSPRAGMMSIVSPPTRMLRTKLLPQSQASVNSGLQNPSRADRRDSSAFIPSAYFLSLFPWDCLCTQPPHPPCGGACCPDPDSAVYLCGSLSLLSGSIAGTQRVSVGSLHLL